jgi:hypothetical protein
MDIAMLSSSLSLGLTRLLVAAEKGCRPGELRRIGHVIERRLASFLIPIAM